MNAWERGDVDAVVSMLAEDAVLAMPPMPTWYSGRDAVRVFLEEFAFAKTWRDEQFVQGERSVRLVPTRANGQIAFAAYHLKPDLGVYAPTALQVLSLRGGRISEITGFVTPGVFAAFGLPNELPA
jgi:RNA polymerase sigma-70 factor (ECF subfamily)